MIGKEQERSLECESGSFGRKGACVRLSKELKNMNPDRVERV